MEFLLIVFVVVGSILVIDAEQRKKAKQKRFDEAYKFNAKNSHGDAQFVTDNNTLKKRGLFRRKGLPIGYSPDGRHELHYPGFGHLLTVAAARSATEVHVARLPHGKLLLLSAKN